MGHLNGQHPADPVPFDPQLPETVLEGLPQWRRDWKEIWHVEMGGRHFVWRSPTRGEVIQHDQAYLSNPEEAVDLFVSSCLLYPDEEGLKGVWWGEWLALYQLVWKTSGFRDAEAMAEKVAMFEEVLGTPDQMTTILLCQAFPGLLPAKINTWQPEELAYHIALAKAIMGVGEDPRKPRRELPLTMGGQEAQDSRDARHREAKEQQRQQQPPDQPSPPPRPAGTGSGVDWESENREYDAFMMD